LEALLADASVAQIILTGPDAALVDRGSGLELHDGSLGDAAGIADVLWRYANTAYPPPAPDNPVVDVRLPDGTRVAAAFPPASPAGLVAAIRRPVLPEQDLTDLIPGGDKDVESLLGALIAARRNVLVTGDAGVLPALLGALAGMMPAERRVVAIGATARGRSGWIDLAPTPDMAGLLRVAAALRPEHVVVGEIAGPEAAELALLSARGQEGVIAALPARAAAEALRRLSALAAPALGNAPATAALLAGAFDAVVTIIASGDGGARIVEIAEPRATGGELGAEVALAFSGGDGARHGSGEESLAGRGVSARLAAGLAAAGSPVPSALAAE
jgi:pilus assembly protein CpaF